MDSSVPGLGPRAASISNLIYCRSVERPEPSVRLIRTAWTILFAAGFAAASAPRALAADNVVLVWDQTIIEAIISTRPGPTVAAREIAVVAVDAQTATGRVFDGVVGDRRAGGLVHIEPVAVAVKQVV